MENSIYIYHHLGMGDHILCNAIVREYSKKYNYVFLFVKPQYFKNVSYMYRDLQNIKFIAMDDIGVKSFMNINPNEEYLIVGITKEWFKKLESKEFETFDHGFYISAEIPLDYKWSHFHFERNIEKEKSIYYDVLGLKDDEEYLFVHEDVKRDRIFKTKYIDTNIKIINPVKYNGIGIFDFIYTIEKAKEVHIHNSSFSCLIDTMRINNPNIFYHEYARKDMGSNQNHKFKNNWTILKQ